METFSVIWPAASIASAAVSPVFMPQTTSVTLMMPVESAPPILLMRGWMENVMLSFRLPSFHWPYSMVSARNISISSWMNAWPTNTMTPAAAIRYMLASAKKNTT